MAFWGKLKPWLCSINKQNDCKKHAFFNVKSLNFQRKKLEISNLKIKLEFRDFLRQNCENKFLNTFSNFIKHKFHNLEIFEEICELQKA